MTEQPRYRTHVGLDEIKPSPTNPRKNFPESELSELAASIKEHGLVTPILLRLSDGESTPPLYELISGERRWRAARLAGLRTIPAVIRDDLSPAAIIEIQLIENLQRQDLHPLEEAEGYGRMMREHGYTADTLAEKIGKSRSYIFGRMKLLDLDEDGRRLFYAGLLNPSTALLISRIPSHKLQAKAIEDLTRKDYNGDAPSVRAAQRLIRDRYMLALDKAPFPTEDGELIATAGACSACPKRTGNNPDLFDDVDSTNVCTDPDCHTAKKMAAAERRAREAGPDVIIVSGEEAEKILPAWSAESRTHAKLDAVCYEDPQHRTYRDIVGDDPKAVILVERADQGDLVPVVAKKVVTEKLKAQGIVTRSQESRDENKKIKAQVAIENTFREALYRKVREDSKLAAADDLRMEYDFGTLLCDALPIITRRFLIDAGQTRAENVAGIWGAIGHNSWDRLEAFRNGMSNYKLEEQLLICLDLALLAELKIDEHNLKRPPEGMLAMAKALDIDTDTLLKAAKEAQKPAKKTKKPSPVTSDDHSHPSEAAQAAELKRAEGAAPTEAARAGEESPLTENPAPACAVAEEQSSAAGAAVEEPSGTGDHSFCIDDTVRVKPELELDGIAHAAAGKGGVIEAIYIDGRAAPITVMIEGDELCFDPHELILIARVEQSSSATRRPSVQYRHPENAELEWTGRGRKPKWVEHCLANGRTLDELKVEGAAA